MIYYPVPLHLQKAYSHEGYKPGDLPVTESLCQSVISLPMPPVWWNSSADVLRTVIIGNDADEGIVTLTSHGLMMNRIDDNMSEIGRTF